MTIPNVPPSDGTEAGCDVPIVSREVMPYGSSANLVAYGPSAEGVWSEGKGTGEPDIGVMVSALLRAKWVIVGVTVLVSATAIPWVWLLISPSFRAAAQILVEPKPKILLFDTDDNGSSTYYRSYLNTLPSLIRSGKILQRVLENEAVRNTSWFSAGQKKPDGETAAPSLEAFAGALSAAPLQNTQLIEVSISTREPKDAKLIVDAVVDEFKKYCDEISQEFGTQRWETLANERIGLQNEIKGLKETRLNLTRNLGTDGPEELRTQLTTQLGVLEAQFAALRREFELTEWDLETLRADRFGGAESGDGQDGAGAQRAAYVGDAEWRSLNIAHQNSVYEWEVARQQYGDGHPVIRQLRAAADHTERQLRQREEQLGTQTRAAPRLTGDGGGGVALVDQKTLERLSERQKQELQLRWDEIEQLRTRIAEVGNIQKRIADYDEEIRQKGELYEKVRGRLTELEMEGKAPARISIASYALEPTAPDRDRRKKLTAVAAGGAFLMGLAVAYLLARLDSRIHQAGDIRGAVRVPFLGQLPSCSSQTNLLADCPPMLIESIRMFRTALLERLASTDKRAVLITSSSPVSGKTSVSILLARSLAALGKKVLLVEADLRRPSMAEKLGLESRPGLAAALAGLAGEEQAIMPTSIAGFDVILAGTHPVHFNPELLANGVFSACLQKWKNRYDYVLLDSPPVLPVADAQILAGQADGVVMVLRASHSRRAEVIQAYADLSAAGGTLLGTVLVDVRPKSCGAYYDSYGSSYPGIPPALAAGS